MNLNIIWDRPDGSLELKVNGDEELNLFQIQVEARQGNQAGLVMPNPTLAERMFGTVLAAVDLFKEQNQ